jgi:hypothetical protein
MLSTFAAVSQHYLGVMTVNNDTLDVVRIPLSKQSRIHSGKYEAIVSPEDGDLIADNWHVDYCNPKRQYAARSTPDTNALHRVIMMRMLGRKLLQTELVDHVDGNGLNCQRSNLRLATRSQNGANQGKTVRNKSGYKGVCWHADYKKWHAQIKSQGKVFSLGLYDDPEVAYQAYCEKAIELHGEFANLGIEKDTA